MPARPARPPSSADRGFTLVEVLVASLILFVAIIGLTLLFASGVKQNAIAKEETAMVAFAQDKLEQLKKLTREDLDALPPDAACRDGICQSRVCAPGQSTNCCPFACYPEACPADPGTWTDPASLTQTFAGLENPVPDPNPTDEINERLYVRYWEVKKVPMGSPIGCVFKMTVIVGSRNGLMSPPPGSAASWLNADWKEVVGLDASYPTNKRRVVLSTYKGR
jgi:type II secretory pathway pseudopilin PulG